MGGQDISFNFPTDMQLQNPPLVEAWIEIRWQLDSESAPHFLRDPFFPYAVGAFYRGVRDRFAVQKNVEASFAPEEMLPYVVRHQFWTGENKWPLLQLGPGVATANFVLPYSWEEFQETSLYLCQQLTEAYDRNALNIIKVALHYRNVEAFDYKNNNLTEFLANKLNTNISLPEFIPGPVSSSNWPTGANISLHFDVNAPLGIGTITIATGTGKKKDDSEERKILLWQLDFSSEGDAAPDISDSQRLDSWLISAHNILHEWFFSLVEGPLLSKYQEGEI